MQRRSGKKVIALVTFFVLFSWLPGSGTPVARAGERVALTGGRVLTMAGEVIDPGTVVMEEGKIVGVTPGSAAPPGARAIAAAGTVIMPGMIDAYTHIGLVEIGAVEATNDVLEGVEPVTPQERVIDAIHPSSELFPVARTTGVTAALCAPGEGTVVSGQSALIHLAGERVEEMVIRFPVGIHVNLGEPPKLRFGKENQEPQTRMGIAALLRGALVEAGNYLHEREAGAGRDRGKDDDESDRNLAREAWLPVLRGEMPLIVRAHRLDDIETALRIADEFGVRIILNHATEAYRIAGELARRRVPVLVGPVTTQPSRMETLGAIYENAAILAEAGVRIALQTADAHNVRNLPYQAGLAVAYGLPREEALRAITRYPAEIFGVSDRIGTLEAGKDADIAVFDGDPLEPRTRLLRLFIGGEEMDVDNRQEELYRRYRD